MTYSRPVSPAERLWLAADDLLPPFVIELVVEGVGALPEDLWTDALARTAEAMPAARCTVRGWVSRARWVDRGVAPSVRFTDAAAWDGTTAGGTPHSTDRLSAWTGPVMELLLAPGDPARLVLRVHHAAMDGVGLLMFARELFRAARGQPPGLAAYTTSDLQLVRQLGVQRGPLPKDAHVAATGRHDGSPHGAVWGRRRIRGRWRRFLPRMASVVARHARQLARDNHAPVCIHIPVDLRRYLDGGGGVGNLTGLIAMPIEPGATADDIATELRRRLDADEAPQWVAAVGGMVHVPMWLMRWAGARGADTTNKEGRYGATAILSNVGHFAPEAFQAPGFTASDAFFIPPGGRATAAFMGMSRWGTEDTSIVATMPVGMASGGRLDALLDAMVDDLQR